MIKQTLLLVITYILITQNDGSISKQASQGMSEDIVKQLLDERGVSYKIVSQKEFDAVPDVKPVVVPNQNLLDAKDPTKTPQERIDALIKVLGE